VKTVTNRKTNVFFFTEKAVQLFYYFSENVCPNKNTHKNLLANPNPSPRENTGCPTEHFLQKCNQIVGMQV